MNSESFLSPEINGVTDVIILVCEELLELVAVDMAEQLASLVGSVRV